MNPRFWQESPLASHCPQANWLKRSHAQYSQLERSGGTCPATILTSEWGHYWSIHERSPFKLVKLQLHTLFALKCDAMPWINAASRRGPQPFEIHIETGRVQYILTFKLVVRRAFVMTQAIKKKKSSNLNFRGFETVIFCALLNQAPCTAPRKVSRWKHCRMLQHNEPDRILRSMFNALYVCFFPAHPNPFRPSSINMWSVFALSEIQPLLMWKHWNDIAWRENKSI